MGRTTVKDHVLSLVAERGPLPVAQIIAETPFSSPKNIRGEVQSLAQEGKLERVSRGVYGPPAGIKTGSHPQRPRFLEPRLDVPSPVEGLGEAGSQIISIWTDEAGPAFAVRVVFLARPEPRRLGTTTQVFPLDDDED